MTVYKRGISEVMKVRLTYSRKRRI